MNRDVLLVMNCRSIPECLRSYDALEGVDKAFATGYTETGLEQAFEKFIGETDYGNYIFISDDVVANQDTLDRVLHGLDKFPIVTGYCNIDPESPFVNLSAQPLQKTWPATVDDYHFMPKVFADYNDEPFFQTWFAGLCMTGLSREMVLKFPFRCFKGPGKQEGWGSDYNLSWRLQQHSEEIRAARGAFCKHLGGNMRLPPTLIGRVPAHVKLVKEVSA
jgi:hypothetical protein